MVSGDGWITARQRPAGRPVAAEGRELRGRAAVEGVVGVGARWRRLWGVVPGSGRGRYCPVGGVWRFTGRLRSGVGSVSAPNAERARRALGARTLSVSRRFQPTRTRRTSNRSATNAWARANSVGVKPGPSRVMRSVPPSGSARNISIPW